MASLDDQQPDALIDALGSASVVAFEPRRYVTVDLGLDQPADIARWIDAYFTQTLGAGPDTSVSVVLEEI